MDNSKRKGYSSDELKTLHKELYQILEEIIRICTKYDIPYFIQGGTAIGAFYENAILPWDDDIDIGLTRENYNRFLEIAPKELNKDYFLQHVLTDSHTPFYFTKIRKNNTMFVEKDFKHLPIHHGLYIDVFPFDKVPDNKLLQKSQRIIANFFNCCFMGNVICMW